MSTPIETIRAALQRMHHTAIGTSDRAYMSIPADPKRDADLILSAAIDELAALRVANSAEIASLQGELAKETAYHLAAKREVEALKLRLRRARKVVRKLWGSDLKESNLTAPPTEGGPR